MERVQPPLTEGEILEREIAIGVLSVISIIVSAAFVTEGFLTGNTMHAAMGLALNVEGVKVFKAVRAAGP